MCYHSQTRLPLLSEITTEDILDGIFCPEECEDNTKFGQLNISTRTGTNQSKTPPGDAIHEAFLALFTYQHTLVFILLVSLLSHLLPSSLSAVTFSVILVMVLAMTTDSGKTGPVRRF